MNIAWVGGLPNGTIQIEQKMLKISMVNKYAKVTNEY